MAAEASEEPLDLPSLFHTELVLIQEEKWNGEASAKAAEVNLWLKPLPEEEHTEIEKGIKAIFYQGSKDSAKKASNKLVQQGESCPPDASKQETTRLTKVTVNLLDISALFDKKKLWKLTYYLWRRN